MKTFRHRQALFSTLIACLLPVAFYLLPLNHVGANTSSTSTREERLAVFDDVWETVRARYYDPDLRGLDWEAEREAWRPLAAEARTSAELYSVLRRLLAPLRDAHTRVYAPDEKFDWQHPRFIGVGLSVREVAGQPVVVQVERGSEAERAGVRAGDVLVSIDDQPALALFERHLRETAGASTLAATRLRAMSALFEGASETPVRVGWIDTEGRAREATLKRKWQEREVRLVFKRVDGYGVVQFDGFTQGVARDFWRMLRGELKSVRGLVLDLRGNGGGEAEVMVDLASAFLPAGQSLGQFIDRSGRVAFVPQTRATLLLTPDQLVRFTRPVVILTSERTSSAAEIFAAALSEAGRARVIGGPTCGCVLAIRRRHTLPDGGELNVSEMDYRTARGTRLEGAGVKPDETVSLDRKDLRANFDRAAMRALELLREEKQRKD